jgi:alpha-1,2-mannosyltransferase
MSVSSASSSSSAWQRWFVGGLLFFFVALSVQYTLKVHDEERSNRSAILRWRDQILELDNGTDIWDRFVYPNPPIMVLLLSPLAHLPPILTSLTWFYLKVAMALLAIRWCFQMVETGGRTFPAWGKALAVLLSLRPIMGDLSHGNVNLFILFLVVGSLYAFHRRQEMLAGLGMALAIACKVTPALFVPYFLWKRSWKTVAGCAAGMVLFFWLVPGVILGFDDNNRYLESWVKNMILPYVVAGEITPEHNNQSLPALVHRLFTASPSFTTYVDDVKTPVEYHNFLELDPQVARWLVKGCLGLFAVLVLWSCRTLTSSGQNWRMAAEFSIIVLGMLLFSERTWKHHCVTLLLPFTVLAYYLSAWARDRKMKVFLGGTLTCVALLMAATSTGVTEGHDRPGKLAQVYGAYVWAFFLLTMALVVVLRRRDGRGRGWNTKTASGEHVRNN